MIGLEHLLEDDKAFLERKGWDTEVKKITVNNSQEIQIVIHKFLLPSKYSPSEVDLLVRQLPGYPEAGMDMFWTKPDVILTENNQKPQATEVHEKFTEFGDEDWQRWSRHMNGWRSGTDNLETFFAAIQNELNK